MCQAMIARTLHAKESSIFSLFVNDFSKTSFKSCTFTPTDTCRGTVIILLFTHAQGPTLIQLHEETCRNKTPQHSSSVLQQADKLFFMSFNSYNYWNRFYQSKLFGCVQSNGLSSRNHNPVIQLITHPWLFFFDYVTQWIADNFYLTKRWYRGLKESGQPGCTYSQKTRCLPAAVAAETLPLFPLPPLPFRSAPELPTETSSSSSAVVLPPLLPSLASARPHLTPQWSWKPQKSRRDEEY